MKYEMPKKGQRRPPLMKITELAEEFGMTPQQLGGYLSSKDAPAMQLHCTAHKIKAKWYNPVEVRAFLRGVV